RLEGLRAEALAAGRTPRYDGLCRRLDPAAAAAREAAGEPAALRLAVPAREVAFDDLIRGTVRISSEVISDFIIVRSDERFERAILDDLAWLGLGWDEGPEVGGPYGPYRQAERAPLYREAAERLLAAGKAYRCFCSEERLEGLRAEALAAGRTPRYDGLCRRLDPAAAAARQAAGEPAALRLAVPAREIVFDDLIRGTVRISSDVISDFIIVRSDGMAGYNFAVVVDDIAMAITHVIRGDDHLTNTARQLLLYDALGATPPAFAHHAMILAPDGGKLSKRHGAAAVGDFRELGYLPQAIVNYIGLLGWSHGGDEVLGLERLVADFDLGRLSGSPAEFDMAKLDWLDHEWIMAASDDEHERRVGERLPAGTPVPAIKALAAACKPSLVRYGDAPAFASQVLERPALEGEARRAAQAARDRLALFAGLRREAGAGWLTSDEARDLLGAYRLLGKEHGFSPRDLLMPLRLVLTGREHGPELHYVLAALDGRETIARVDAGLGADLTRTAHPDQGDQR
ncbi:MAG TPA: glutamate--tRNA ligase, partial [Thermoleophilia bacterium]|nr:glutamate--tRNA ligase [Thermoleophilia bacterium]